MDIARQFRCFVFIWEVTGSNLCPVLTILKCFVVPPLQKFVLNLQQISTRTQWEFCFIRLTLNFQKIKKVFRIIKNHIYFVPCSCMLLMYSYWKFLLKLNILYHKHWNRNAINSAVKCENERFTAVSLLYKCIIKLAAYP
jgi:hypothetical protein